MNEIENTVFLAHKGQNEELMHTWYLDSGVSNHMCSHRHMFVEMDEFVWEILPLMGNNIEKAFQKN